MSAINSLIAKARRYIVVLQPQQSIALLVTLSALVAWRITYLQHGWVNDDSLLYFEVARLLADEQWQAAYKLFPWLFYPALLAGGHLASGLDIHTTAQVINIAFFTLFSWGFALLILQAGGTIRTMWWGGLLLLSTQYIVGDILGMLLRDEGFWAGLTWALLFMLRYMQRGKVPDAYYFQMAIMAAMLFRLEAIVYFILPLSILANHALPLRQRLYKTTHGISIPLCGGLLISAAVIVGMVEITHLGRLQEIIYLLKQGFIERLQFIQSKADLMGKQVLGHHLANYSNFAIWSVLILITLNKTLKVAGWPVLLALIVGKKAWCHMHHQARLLFSLQLAVGFITSVLIIINAFVLSSRYVIASGIVMLVIAAFCAEYLYKKATPWAKRGLVLLLTGMLFANLYDFGKIDLDRRAVEYLQTISTPAQPVLYDTENARFYAHQPFLERIPAPKLVESLLANGKISDYHYLMISIADDHAAYEQAVRQKLDTEFEHIHTLYGWKKKTKVLVYRKRVSPPS
jgi:hypothetical protein